MQLTHKRQARREGWETLNEWRKQTGFFVTKSDFINIWPSSMMETRPLDIITNWIREALPRCMARKHALLYSFTAHLTLRGGVGGGGWTKLWTIILNRCLCPGPVRCRGGQICRYARPQEHEHARFVLGKTSFFFMRTLFNLARERVFILHL